jgi:zinc carboxypeptidase
MTSIRNRRRSDLLLLSIHSIVLCFCLVGSGPAATSVDAATGAGSAATSGDAATEADTSTTSSTSARTGKAGDEAILPPVRKWNGPSRALVVKRGNPWITPAEASGLTRTPTYDETVAYLKRLAEAAPELKMVSLGKSGLGVDIWMVIASAERAFTPEALRATGKPTLLAHSGIHAGEIDGKDSGMMLLRDMTVRGTRRELLRGANFLFIPILNVDGHQRLSRYGRINQRGPVETGWRTNSRNDNLNRDFAKLDTPEIGLVVDVINAYDPDLYVDLHVTDGADYQYDVTYGYNGPHGWSPSIATWLDREFTPAVNRDLKAMGHVPGPLIGGFTRGDINQGIVDWTAGPRFSTGYGDARHLPVILVENHSLKPYDQRVLGDYVFLEGALKVLASRGKSLRQAVAADRGRRRAEIPLDWKLNPEAEPPVEFLGIESRVTPSAVSGELKTEYTGKPITLKIPRHVVSLPAVSVKRPRAYWIPPQWSDLIARVARHGIQMERIDFPREMEVETYRLDDAKTGAEPFEGHMPVTVNPSPIRRRLTFPAGSVRIPTDQPLGDLAALLLEPGCPDSFFRWGFMLELLDRTEYVEDYVMEPMAERMLAENPELRKNFQDKLRDDSAFRGDPRARLNWFYERTPFYDPEYHLYPIAREP